MNTYHVIDAANKTVATFTDAYLRQWGRERILKAFPGCVVLHYFNGGLIGAL